jgi:xylose isomerase
LQKFKIAIFPSILGNAIDRFGASYHESLDFDKSLHLATKLKGIQGVDLIYPSQIKEDNLDEVRDKVKSFGFEIAGISLDLYSGKNWINGSYTNVNKDLRKKSVEVTKRALDLAVDLGVSQLSIWPGQDGFDYIFQRDYRKAWIWLVESVKECGGYNKKIELCLEAKPKEPRAHSFLNTTCKCLLLINEVNLKNVGGIIDFGHSLFSYENPAESAILLNQYNKLFRIHLNDNYRDWDHDLIVGSVNFWELLEFLFWLREIRYKGWYCLDVFPYREDPIKAFQLSVNMINRMAGLLDKINFTSLKQDIKEDDVIGVISTLQKEIFKETHSQL